MADSYSNLEMHVTKLQLSVFKIIFKTLNKTLGERMLGDKFSHPEMTIGNYGCSKYYITRSRYGFV
jgi:hypothetical protein